MASETSIEGIRKFGLGWKSTIRLLAFTKSLGNANDNGIDDMAAADSVTHDCRMIAKTIRKYLEIQANEEVRDAFILRHEEDLSLLEEINVHEDLASGGYEPLDEINFVMNRIYDTFDFYRILVV